MKWVDFKKAHKFQMAEQCCANCKHGEEGYEGECGCIHPLVDPDEIWQSGGTIADVCDLWEREGGVACTIQNTR